MNLDILKERLGQKFGDDVKTETVAGILIVHLDKPDDAERKRRQVEVRQGNFEAEDDCRLCQEMKADPPQVVIYDKDSMLCLGSGKTGLLASRMPQKNAGNASSDDGKHPE